MTRVTSVDQLIPVYEAKPVRKTERSGKLQEVVDFDDSYDEVSFSTKKELSKPQKQEILRSARQKAAGYSCFGGLFSTLYYALRSNEKIARKYNLDPIADRAFIKQIKEDQTMWTLPATLGSGILGIVAYAIACNKDASTLAVN